MSDFVNRTSFKMRKAFNSLNKEDTRNCSFESCITPNNFIASDDETNKCIMMESQEGHESMVLLNWQVMSDFKA